MMDDKKYFKLYGSQKEVTLKDIFKHRGRVCIVMEIKLKGMDSWHNGYVSVATRNEGKEYNNFIDKIDCCVLTFSGHLPQIDSLWYFGFDTAHYWNEKRPETKTYEDVKRKTKLLADEMVDKGI